MTQFDLGFGTDPHKLVRTADPDTSHAAAQAVNSAHLEQQVLAVIQGYGDAGCTQDEVLSHFPGYPYSSVTARFKALLDHFHVVDTGERRNGRSGRKQRVLRATR